MFFAVAASPERFLPILCALFVGFFVYELCAFYNVQGPQFPHTSSSLSRNESSDSYATDVLNFAGAANSTLGFEAIFVVSPNKSLGGETTWRQEGIIRAANLTDLTLHIPTQPNWTTVDWITPTSKQKIEAKSPDGSLDHGQVMCRLGHLSILQQISSSNLSSAILMENDADWAVEIRSQTSAVARAIQNLTHDNDTINPWGTHWDLLILGHCGAGHRERSEYAIINDTTAISPELYSNLRDPGRETPVKGRLVYASSGAACTYAYAVTRAGAAKIFDISVDSPAPWDLQLGDLCGQGKIDCYAVAPELFHHQRWTGHKVVSGGDLHGQLQLGERSQKFTNNIVHSARCNSEPDVDTKKGLIQCLPMGYTRKVYPT